MKPPPLPEKSRVSSQSSWNNVGYSAVAIMSAGVTMPGFQIAKTRGASSFIALFGVALVLVAVGVCLWFFFRCPRHPLAPKLVCLVLFGFSLYLAVDWIVNWAF